MSPIWEFSESDLLRGKVVVPGWYRVRIDDIGEEAAKVVEGKTPSTNYPVDATILFNGDTGDTEFAKVPIQWNFNSKFKSAHADFLRAFGVDIKASTRFDPRSAIGREVDIFIENGTWQGRLKNQVNHSYRAPRPDVTAVTAGV